MFSLHAEGTAKPLLENSVPYSCPEKRRDAQRQFRLENRERLREYYAIYRAANREKIKSNFKDWAKKNPEKLLTIQRQSYARHRDIKLARQREYYKTAKGSEVHLIKQRRWRAAHPHEFAIQQAKKNIARSVGIPYRDVPDEIAEATASVAKILSELRGTHRKTVR